MATPNTVHQEMLTLFNKRDFGAMRALFHPEYTYTGGDGSRFEGPDAGIAVAKGYAAALPDVQAEILTVIVQGDVAVAEYRVRGTHMGDLMGIGPTGNAVDLVACNIIELKDGQVFSEREYFDSMAMWAQLGVVHVPGGH